MDGRKVAHRLREGRTEAEWMHALWRAGAGISGVLMGDAEIPAGPVNLDEVLAAACEGVAGITPAQFRSLLSPEDVADIEAGEIGVETIRSYALSFAAGIGSGRVVVPGGEPEVKA
ncbi:MAG: hypothetical protein ACREA0_29485 [bacterium]